MNEKSKLRLAFMGSPEFANATLRALIDAGHDVACVYAQPPRPAGRGHKERRCPVHQFADERGIEVRTPLSLKDADAQAEFEALGLDAAVVVAYGLLLPEPVLNAPRLGCLNVHASLLPRWRGAAPIQRAILAGDDETGVTIMKMDEGLDTGPVLSEVRTPISDTDDATTLHSRLAEMGAALLVQTLALYAAGSMRPNPQPETGATYAAKLDREEGRLDFSQPARLLERRLRALSPWPGTYFEIGDQRIKVLAADVGTATVDTPPGTVIDDDLTIACGAGTFRPTKIQRPGKAAMPTADVLRGHPIAPGTVLEKRSV